MARGLISDLALYRDTLNSNSLYIGENPEITVYEAGTTTPIDGDDIYSVPSGGSPLGTNPVQGNSDGSFVFWFDNPRLVKLSIEVPGIGTLVRDNIPPWTDPTQDVTLDGFEVFSNKTLEDWLSKNGAFFDVGAYKYNASTLLYDEDGLDPYDLDNDATPALHLASAAAEAIGGGLVLISKLVSIQTTYEHYYTNVKIVCVGDGTANSAQKVGIRLDVSEYPAIAVRDKADEFGTSGYVSTGNETQFWDVTFYFNNSINDATGGYAGADAVVLLYKVSPTSASDTSAFNGRVHFHGCSFTGGKVNIQIGLDSVKGAGEVIVDHCKFQSVEDSILIAGVDYLFIHNIIAGQLTRTVGTAFLRLSGTNANQPDSLVVRDVFTEDYYAAVMLRHGDGSVGNGYIESCVFDGCHIGIWMDANGTINGLVVRNNYLTGYSSLDGLDGLGLSWGILIQRQGTGNIGGLWIHHNRITAFALEAILVTAPGSAAVITDVRIEDNWSINCGSSNSAGDSAISICASANGSSSFGVTRLNVARNIIITAGISGAGHIHAYGVTIGLSCDKFVVEFNVAMSVTSYVINRLQTGNLTDKIYRFNVGPRPTSTAPTQMAFTIDGFIISNIGISATTQLDRFSNGIRSWVAPYDIWITAATVDASANVTAGTITFKIFINGVESVTIAPTVAIGSSIGFDTDDNGIAVSQGQRVEVVAVTNGSYAPITNDYAVGLVGVSQGY